MSFFRRFFAALLLFVKYTGDFWKANITIARQVLSPKLEIEPESITLDTKVEKPSEILTLANLITFTPGTLVLDVEPGDHVVVHVLDKADEARESIPRDLEQPILKVTRGHD
ncbi:MAG: Na+/H+ antiporter subunit E [Verrucomicrobiales bacterium]|nr:Na+/H+ antiporter subunit E [Verrucomicrobiales bacterium]